MPRADAARWEGVTAALQLTPSPELPDLRADVIVPTIDVVQGGIVRPRVRNVRVVALTGALAAASMTSSLRVFPAPGFVWRVLRVQAYVRNNTLAGNPREPTLRNLTAASIRLNGLGSRPIAESFAVGSNGGVSVADEVAAVIAHSDAAAVVIDRPTNTTDSDELANWTGAARGTYAGPPLLVGELPGDLTGQSSIEFYYRRTPAAADVDRVVMVLSIVAAHAGMIPPL